MSNCNTLILFQIMCTVELCIIRPITCIEKLQGQFGYPSGYGTGTKLKQSVMDPKKHLCNIWQTQIPQKNKNNELLARASDVQGTGC